MLKILTSEECRGENQIVENSGNFGQSSLCKPAIFLVSRLKKPYKVRKSLARRFPKVTRLTMWVMGMNVVI